MRAVVRAWPLPTAWAAAGLCLCTAVVAFASGNNGAFWLLAAVLSLFLVDAVAGGANLMGLSVRRQLPGELYVGHRAHGHLIVDNRMPWRAHAVAVTDDEDTARAVTADVPARGERALSCGWTFEQRGAAVIHRLTVASQWPFGLFERRVTHDVVAEILVYPRPIGGADRHGGAQSGDGDARDPRPGDGDFAGLRPYVAGDALRSVHWPTTARLGTPMVIARAGEATERCVVRVDPTAADPELELARACGEVVRAFGRGAFVGLDLPSRRYEARPGDAWRRALLEALAREPA